MPNCPYAGKCGGCQLQRVRYSEQLLRKQQRMEALLGDLCRVEPILGMEEPYHYRCKAIAAYSYDGHRTLSGMYQAGTHRVVPVEHCLIEHEAADAVLATIRGLVASLKIPAYCEENGTGFLRHVLVRVGRATGQLLVVLVAASPLFGRQKLFLQQLLAAHPAVRSVVLNHNDRITPVVLGDREKVIYGPGYIEDVLCGLTFRISSRSFFQVNPTQAELLYEKAMELAALTGKERVIDAYCGTGTIGLIAARQAGEVLGVEQNRDAVRDAIANAHANGIRNARFYPADAGIFLEELRREGEHADTVFLDPPRDGSDARFLSALTALRPNKIVYISCGPDTLSRDLRLLCADGYAVRRVIPVDLFPHTEHVETVALLTRAEK